MMSPCRGACSLTTCRVPTPPGFFLGPALTRQPLPGNLKHRDLKGHAQVTRPAGDFIPGGGSRPLCLSGHRTLGTSWGLCGWLEATPTKLHACALLSRLAGQSGAADGDLASG